MERCLFTVSRKGQILYIIAWQAHQSLLQQLNSTIAGRNQPQTVSKQMETAVFQ